jgi:quercetin dioxygenase-like cupin family protein
MRLILLGSIMLSACTALAAHPGSQSGHALPAKVVTTPIVRSGQTISNQPLRLPQGAAEMVAAAIEIAPGGATPIHQHPWSRFVYVEKGPVRIVNHDTGATLDFQSGQVLPEVVGQWHEGRALSAPVRLIVIDVVPPGVNNTVMR